MTSKLPTYGFLGLGNTKDENVELQLDRFMPEDVGDMIGPKVCGPGVRKVIRWLEDAFGTDVERVTDVIDSLAVRKAGGVDATLIVVLADPVDDADVALIVKAIDAGIKVCSINHAMDEVDREDVAPEPAPSEAEKPAAARTRARRGSRTPEPDGASEAVSEPQETKPRRGRPRKTEPAVAEAVPGEVAIATALSAETTAPFWQGTPEELLALIDARVAKAFAKASDALNAPF